MADRDGKTIDCIVCGSCVVDLLCRPVRLDEPIGLGVLHQAEAVALTGGGITCNAGIAMARMGLQVGVFSYIGDDNWGPVLRELFRGEGVDDQALEVRSDTSTSTTCVAIDPSGERSFFHCVGAPSQIDATALLKRTEFFAQSRYLLLGYYSLMPQLESSLPAVFQTLRDSGCRTAMDSAGDGGSMDPLERILPHLDIWVPSLNEARHQTGHDDPQKILETFRSCGAPGLLGVKLGGTDGVLLSPKASQFSHVPSACPPGTVVDTTGAGDSFYAGLITGLVRGLSVEDAGRIGAAAGACCVTAVGGYTGIGDYQATAQIAGLA